MSDLNEHVLEVRYKPNPAILDYRGSWAKAISESIKLPEWKIVENRIDIYKKDKSEHAFVGFRNSGFVAIDTSSNTYFPVKATKFFKYLFSLEGFGKSIHVDRLGVRSRFCKEFKGSFDELRDRYVSQYLSLTDAAIKVIGAELTDIGGLVNFTDKYGNFNTNSGPMEKNQIALFFKRNVDEMPNVGLFYDIDYWITPNKVMGEDEILKSINSFAISTWEKFESISELIIGK